MEDLVLSCLESRVEENRNLYARFLVGPFLKGDALTVATALRRVLLSSVESIGITALYIQGITHEFSTIAGVRESVLELSLNFGAIVLSYDKTFYQKKSFFDRLQIGYLQVQGPKVVYANHLKLPLGVKLIDPTQYIATVSKEGCLVLKFIIGKSEAFHHQNSISQSHFEDQTKDFFSIGEITKKNIVRAKKTCFYKEGSTLASVTTNKFLSTPSKDFAKQNRSKVFLKPYLSQAYGVNLSLIGQGAHASRSVAGVNVHKAKFRRAWSCKQDLRSLLANTVTEQVGAKKKHLFFGKKARIVFSQRKKLDAAGQHLSHKMLGSPTLHTKVFRRETKSVGALHFFNAFGKQEPSTTFGAKTGALFQEKKSFCKAKSFESIARLAKQIFRKPVVLKSCRFQIPPKGVHACNKKSCIRFVRKSKKKLILRPVRKTWQHFCFAPCAKDFALQNLAKVSQGLEQNLQSKSFTHPQKRVRARFAAACHTFVCKNTILLRSIGSPFFSFLKTKKPRFAAAHQNGSAWISADQSRADLTGFGQNGAEPMKRKKSIPKQNSSDQSRKSQFRGNHSKPAHAVSTRLATHRKGKISNFWLRQNPRLTQKSRSKPSPSLKEQTPTLYKNELLKKGYSFALKKDEIAKNKIYYTRVKSFDGVAKFGLLLQDFALQNLSHKCTFASKSKQSKSVAKSFARTKQSFVRASLPKRGFVQNLSRTPEGGFVEGKNPQKLLGSRADNSGGADEVSQNGVTRSARLLQNKRKQIGLQSKQCKIKFHAFTKLTPSVMQNKHSNLLQRHSSKNGAPVEKLKFLNKNNGFKSIVCLRNVIPIDSTLTPILKVNFVVEVDDEALYLRQKIRERISLEVWTNGSIHPRQAVHDAALFLTGMFSSFRSAYGDQSYSFFSPNTQKFNRNVKRSFQYLKHNARFCRTSLNTAGRSHTAFFTT